MKKPQKRKPKSKLEAKFTAQRFARHFPDYDFSWMMENIADKNMKELDRESAKTIVEWIVWIKDMSVTKGRRIEYDRIRAHLSLMMMGNRP